MRRAAASALSMQPLPAAVSLSAAVQGCPAAAHQKLFQQQGKAVDGKSQLPTLVSGGRRCQRVFAAAAQPALAVEDDPRPCWKEAERVLPGAALALLRPESTGGQGSSPPVAGAPAQAPAAQLQQLDDPALPAYGAQPFRLPVPNLGYTCLNISLQQQFGIRTNRCGAPGDVPTSCVHPPLSSELSRAIPLCLTVPGPPSAAGPAGAARLKPRAWPT